MKLSIGRKLTFLFGALIIVLLIESVTSISALNREEVILEEIIVDSEAHEVMDELDVSMHRAFLGLIEEIGIEGGFEGDDEEEGEAEFGEALEDVAAFYDTLDGLANAELTESTPELEAERLEVIALVTELGELIDDLTAKMINAETTFNRNPDNRATTLRNLGEIDEILDASFHPLALTIDTVLTQEVDDLHDLARVSAQQELVTVIILDVIVFAIAIFGVLVIGRGISNSAAHLSEAAEAISRGDMDAPISVTSGDEMQTLAEAIERMRTSLKAAIERLR